MKHIKKARNWLHSIKLYLSGCADVLRLARDIGKITQPDYDGWGYEVGV